MTTKSSNHTLTIGNLSKRFGELEAVSDISFAIKPGEIIGFVGPNGAGKTTTISLIMGFLRPTTGFVNVLGDLILPESAHKVHGRIGYISGDMVLPVHLTGKQYLDFTSHRNGRSDEYYEKLCAQLRPVLNRPIRQLSRGNKQKLALISALQHEPKLLVMDEPTSGLDPLMQDVFSEVVSTEAARGTSVLMSSHILGEVSSICSRIVFMRAGKLILDKPIQEITRQLGKQIIISTKNSKTLVNYLPKEAVLVESTEKQLRVAVDNANIKPFLRWLLTKDFTDILIEERNLDDIFHELYADRRSSKA